MAIKLVDWLKEYTPDSLLKGRQTVADEVKEWRETRQEQKLQDNQANAIRKAQDPFEPLRKKPHTPALKRPTTIQGAIESLGNNSYPASHLSCPEGMKQADLLALAKALKTNKSLTSLDMGSNNLETNTLRALSNGISENKNILSLSNVRNSKADKALYDGLMETIQKNNDIADSLVPHLSQLRTLFTELPHDETLAICAAINERTPAIYLKLQEALQADDFSILNENTISQIFDAANSWSKSHYMPAAHLNVPVPSAGRLEHLAHKLETVDTRPQTRIEARNCDNLAPIQKIKRGCPR